MNRLPPPGDRGRYLVITMLHIVRYFLLLVMLTTVAHAQSPPDEVELAVRRYLSVKYDESEDIGPERRAIYGIAYDPTEAIKPLDIPELESTVLNTKYFTSILITPHTCYSRLEVVVAATKTDSGFVIRSSVSPVYTEPSRKLLSIVRGKMARTEEDRKRLAIGVGKLLAAVTYHGQLKNAATADNAASVELWHGELHWAKVELQFDEENLVQSVFVDSPSANTEDQIK